MKHLFHALIGVGAVVNPLGTRPDYKYPKIGDRVGDYANLSADWHSVGRRLRANTTKELPSNVKSHNRQGQK